MLLETEAARLAIDRIPPEALNEIEAAIETLLACEKPDVADDWAVDSRLHQLIAHHSGNAVLAGMIETLRLKTHMFNLSRLPERFEAGHREHLTIIAALRRRDGEATRTGIKTHLDNVRNSIIAKLSAI